MELWLVICALMMFRLSVCHSLCQLVWLIPLDSSSSTTVTPEKIKLYLWARPEQIPKQFYLQVFFLECFCEAWNGSKYKAPTSAIVTRDLRVHGEGPSNTLSLEFLYFPSRGDLFLRSSFAMEKHGLIPDQFAIRPSVTCTPMQPSHSCTLLHLLQ